MNLTDVYFKDLFENTSDLIQYVSLEGEIEMVNPAWLLNLGYALEEVKGKSIYEFIDPAEADTYKTYRDACINHQNRDDLEITFIAKGMIPVILEGHLRPFFHENKFLHTRGVFRNITVKKEKEKLQQEHLLKFSQFLENAPDAVVIIDEQQIIVEWNLKASEIFGYSRKEVINQQLAAFIIPIEYREAHHRGLRHFLATGEGPVLNKTIEVPAIDKSNREFPINLNISSVKLQDQWFFIAFMNDISEKKKNEQILRQKDLELEKTKLEDAQKMDFLTIASHELKTPLTSMKAYVQLALREIETRPTEQVINLLRKADSFSDKLNKLILNLLDISKIQSGKLRVEKQPTDITSLVRDVVNSSQLLYTSHIISFRSDKDYIINIDRSRIEQVFVNLINNAVKYSPKADKVEIEIKQKQDFIYISVKDYGTGIESINQTKVFEKFYRVDELSKNDTQSLGIGLYISSEIVKQHGGKIWVENNNSGGATFFVVLPVNV
ncbi:PAS domain S-box protein [Paradesertivirga mongoliensis]|uniref:histidine kinase n=1 Tax=Paradesertivirga mongoliensis TaxID=2100740 RepID=A0ABW4ZQR4_9SPHI|nr:PAS domain S-box protein [Pedobacter mongoliensis]